MKKFLLFSIVVAGAAYLYSNCCCHKKEELFRFSEDHVWGNSKPDSAIKPFTFKLDAKEVEDLKRRLNKWRRHEPMTGQGHFYGISPDLLDNLVKHWREKYDFNKFETTINKLPQFTTVVQGLNLHFVHAKADPKATKK